MPIQFAIFAIFIAVLFGLLNNVLAKAIGERFVLKNKGLLVALSFLPMMLLTACLLSSLVSDKAMSHLLLYGFLSPVIATLPATLLAKFHNRGYWALMVFNLLAILGGVFGFLFIWAYSR